VNLEITEQSDNLKVIDPDNNYFVQLVFRVSSRNEALLGFFDGLLRPEESSELEEEEESNNLK